MKAETTEAQARAAQRMDQTPVQSATPAPTHDQIRVRAGGHDVVPVRIKSTGLGELCDGDIDELLREQGADIVYAADALSGGHYVGTLTCGPLREVCYILHGQRRYMYVVTHSMVESWYQTWWVSATRYSAQAAARLIEDAQALAGR
ncbi:MAG: hypothetical protein GX537_03065 [Actinobacteria bacterium]|nr:hypothetical protein [Actinomycetota bacterium]